MSGRVSWRLQIGGNFFAPRLLVVHDLLLRMLSALVIVLVWLLKPYPLAVHLVRFLLSATDC
jgi:hypothetical protein